MNIALLSYHTCPLASLEGKETGGMNIYVLELSRALARMGHRVDVFTRSHESNDSLVTTKGDGLRFIHLPAGPQEDIPKKKLLAYIPEFSRQFGEFVEKEHIRYDVLHAHYYQSGLSADLIAKAHPVPVVVQFHTLALMKNLVARDETEKESTSRIGAELSLMQSSAKIIASSESDRDYMEYLYDTPKRRIAVVSPGIDPQVFHPVPQVSARTHIHADKQHKIVLFVGRIEPLKGIDTLMYAMKILKKKHPSQTVCLWIVGGDTSESIDHWPKVLQELSHIRKTLSLPESCVHFVGHKNQDELRYYYNAADVVVMPSHYESFGMTALEAMGCGVPVITTNVAGISATLDSKNSPLVASVNNPLLLASQIQKVLTSPHIRQEFSAAVDRIAHDFSWDRVAKETIVVYNSVI